MGTPVHTAGAAAWRVRRPLSHAAALIVLAGGLLLTAVVAPVLSLLGGAPGPLTRAPTGAIAGIPAAYLPIYRAAGDHYGVSWALLAALHRKETDFSRLRAPNARGDAVSGGWNGCGAAGPAQFGIIGVTPYRATVTSCPGSPAVGAGPTWRLYRDAARPIETDRPASYPQMAAQLAGCRHVGGHGCVYDDFDALAAAAAYLKALGARPELDDRAWRAARAYNGAAIYADVVLAWARNYDQAVTTPLTPSLGDPLFAPARQVPGAQAELQPDGRAAAPASAPSMVRRAIAAGNAISDRPYRLVHYPTHINNPTYDCSSSSSHVLWAAGVFGLAPAVSGSFMGWGEPGPGRWITVYANDGHMFLTVAGLRFDTSRYDAPGAPNARESGPRWRIGPRPTTNFVVRHPKGL
jgi:hypothetical protein